MAVEPLSSSELNEFFDPAILEATKLVQTLQLVGEACMQLTGAAEEGAADIVPQKTD